jgi:hypothetical protein
MTDPSSAKPASSQADDSRPFETPYPSYQVLTKWESPSFDDVTRLVIAKRLGEVPARQFFSPADFALLRAVMNCVLPQPERSADERIPVEAFIDEMLQANRGNGTRLEGTPTQRQAWLHGLQGIQHESKRRHQKEFADLSADQQADVMRAIDNADIDEQAWKGLHPQRFFRSILLKESVKAYYAHPFAWNEIGFGGPASPRGYVRLGPDERDPWEAVQERKPQSVKGSP